MKGDIPLMEKLIFKAICNLMKAYILPGAQSCEDGYWGRTPLHLAVLTGNKECVTFLFQLLVGGHQCVVPILARHRFRKSEGLLRRNTDPISKGTPTHGERTSIRKVAKSKEIQIPKAMSVVL